MTINNYHNDPLTMEKEQVGGFGAPCSGIVPVHGLILQAFSPENSHFYHINTHAILYIFSIIALAFRLIQSFIGNGTLTSIDLCILHALLFMYVQINSLQIIKGKQLAANIYQPIVYGYVTINYYIQTNTPIRNYQKFINFPELTIAINLSNAIIYKISVHHFEYLFIIYKIFVNNIHWHTILTLRGKIVYVLSFIGNKDRFNLSQSKLDIIGTIGRFGIFNNYYGATVSVWFGLLFNTFGRDLLTLFTTEIINISSLSYSYIIIGICNFLYLHGNVWYSGIADPTIAQNIPKKDHGKLLGLAKRYL